MNQAQNRKELLLQEGILNSPTILENTQLAREKGTLKTLSFKNLLESCVN